jgi:hypothetical protein
MGLALLPTGCESRSATAMNGNASGALEKGNKATKPNQSRSRKAEQVEEEETVEAAVPIEDSILDKTFDDIKFEMQPDARFERSMLTGEIESLDGRRIRIRGYILPTAQKRGIKQFVLVRDNQECCFGPGAALYDCILVHMDEGKSAEFSIRPVAVEGRFKIEVFPGPDGTPLAIYHLQGESVR